MKPIITGLFLIIISLTASAQDGGVTGIKGLYDEHKFDEIIDNYAIKAEKYSARAIYYIGMAYYMKADDNNCIKYMEMSIDKDPNDPDPHYIIGMTYNYMKQFERAIKYFNKAIGLNSANSNYYSGLGDSYFNLEKLENALEAYQKSTELENPPDRPYTVIPYLYSSLDQKDKALEAFYIAKDKISKKEDPYINVLFGIGQMEAAVENYDKAELAFTELIALAPSEYHSYARLIQIYNVREQYDKAEPLKQKLYDAYKEGLLKGNMKDMFCLDEFKWEDKLILVYENFAEPEGELYYKHVFYVLNKDDDVEFRIQTESFIISNEVGDPKYILGMDKGDTHFTFNVTFNEDFKYEELKSKVIEVLEGEIKPGAYSRKK